MYIMLLSSLIPPHFCVCSKSGSAWTLNPICHGVFRSQWLEVTGDRLVDIGGKELVFFNMIFFYSEGGKEMLTITV